MNLNDIQDRTAQIVNGRAERRAAEREQKRASDYAMSRANLSGVTSPGGRRCSTMAPSDPLAVPLTRRKPRRTDVWRITKSRIGVTLPSRP